MKADQLRAEVTAHCDFDLTLREATRLSNLVNDELNEISAPGGLNVASSIMARALICHGIIHVAAQYWSNLCGEPLPECYKAVRAMSEELPPWVEQSVVDVGGEEL